MNYEQLPIKKDYKCHDDNLILDILRIEMRGLSLVKEINRLCEEQVRSVYQTLTRLEIQGYVESRFLDGENSKVKVYKATREGGKKLYEDSLQSEIQDTRGGYGDWQAN